MISLKSVRIETPGVCTRVLLKNADFYWVQRYSLIAFYQGSPGVNFQGFGSLKILILIIKIPVKNICTHPQVEPNGIIAEVCSGILNWIKVAVDETGK